MELNNQCMVHRAASALVVGVIAISAASIRLGASVELEVNV